MRIKHLKALILILLVAISLPIRADYASSSRLSSGKWVKIRVSQSGVCKISYLELKKAGFSEPQKVRVYGYGGAQLSEDISSKFIDDLPQVPLYVDNKEGYILFYAQGPISWNYNQTTKQFEHTTNTYSFYGYYFLTDRYGAQTTFPAAQYAINQADTTITVCRHLALYDEDKINLINSGRKFYGYKFNLSTPSYKQLFEANNLAKRESSVRINAAHIAFSAANIAVDINGSKIGNLSLPTNTGLPNYVHATEGTQLLTFTPSSSRLTLTLTYSHPSSEAYLNFIELNLWRALTKSEGSVIDFYADPYGNTPQYNVSSASTNTLVWDVTDLANIRKVTTSYSNNKLSFVAPADSTRHFVVLDTKKDNFITAEFLGSIKNQNLHSHKDVDMIIISDKGFLSQADRIASYHANYDGFNTLVVTPQQVYNEFSSGTPDATAYRLLAKMIYQKSAQLKYLLFIGDGSFDNRQILSANTDKNIYRTLTYQSIESFSDATSYVTDDYFGMLEDAGTNIAKHSMQISVGRIPVYDYEQAVGVVDKILAYMENEDFGKWKNLAIFMADDGDTNVHIEAADTISNAMQKDYPDLLTRKLFFDSYKQQSTAQGETYPMLKTEFDNYIKNGVLLINYVGHGGYNGWANERILTMEDIVNMRNKRLPLWITATCDFARFDDFKDSGGECLLYNPNGGASALVTTTRTVFARQNQLFNTALAEVLLAKDESGQLTSVGEAVKYAKNKRAEANDANRLSFTLFGDPAMRLNYPTTHRVYIDSINHLVPEEVESVGALDYVTLSGSVHNVEGDVIDNQFNGIVNINVYDKVETVRTLCNDIDAIPYEYKYRTNPLFVGDAKVKNGKFELTFVIPKDIKYNVGQGRIVMYAYDEQRGVDGNGNFEQIYIGGENENAVLEYKGPEVIAYLNTPYFVNGEVVKPSPLFVAKINDKSGINTIGSGFGHDIILKLDNDPDQEYVLNDYYQADLGTFTQGTILYQLLNLEPGEHSLLFRVWDLQNNSTSITLNFVVEDGLKPEIRDAYAYPNPVKDYTIFHIEHDRPLQQLNVKYFIYNMYGMMLLSEEVYVLTDSSSNIEFECSSIASIPEGLYFTRVIITDDEGNSTSKTIKFIKHKQ